MQQQRQAVQHEPWQCCSSSWCVVHCTLQFEAHARICRTLIVELPHNS